MGLYHGIGDGATPFHGTDGEDGETAITRNVAQSVGEVALPLAAQTGNAMERNGLQQVGGKIEALQEFQAIDQAVDVGRVPPHLEPAQPDELTYAAIDFLGEQPVESHAQDIVQDRGDACVHPALCGNECARAKVLQDRRSRRDHPPGAGTPPRTEAPASRSSLPLPPRSRIRPSVPGRNAP